MTGGYGCIGTWVAKQLCESGSGSLDLRPQGRHASARPGPRPRAEGGDPLSSQGDVSDVDALRSAVEQGRGNPYPSPGGAANADLPGQPDSGCEGQRDRHAGGIRGGDLRTRTRSSGSSTPARRLSTDRPSRTPLAPSATWSAWPRSSHYGAFKVCNELNARVYWLDHGITSIGLRPWTVYGVGRDFGMTSEPTKAIKAVAAGPAVSHQLRRHARPSVRGRRRRDVRSGA